MGGEARRGAGDGAEPGVSLPGRQGRFREKNAAGGNGVGAVESLPWGDATGPQPRRSPALGWELTSASALGETAGYPGLTVTSRFAMDGRRFIAPARSLR